MRLGEHAHQARELDVLSTVRLICQRLHGRQEPKVLYGLIWRRHGCIAVSAHIINLAGPRGNARIKVATALNLRSIICWKSVGFAWYVKTLSSSHSGTALLAASLFYAIILLLASLLASLLAFNLSLYMSCFFTCFPTCLFPISSILILHRRLFAHMPPRDSSMSTALSGKQCNKARFWLKDRQESVNKAISTKVQASGAHCSRPGTLLVRCLMVSVPVGWLWWKWF
jgi:hypothetical protein